MRRSSIVTPSHRTLLYRTANSPRLGLLAAAVPLPFRNSPRFTTPQALPHSETRPRSPFHSSPPLAEARARKARHMRHPPRAIAVSQCSTTRRSLLLA
ncbi:hypothetical protein BC830DRAFT_716933 [Chytriomyces sp. MP71]|nr:hypothetical protein BC830DRAFT_716933 [Chytriomyces sp. MP71]